MLQARAMVVRQYTYDYIVVIYLTFKGHYIPQLAYRLAIAAKSQPNQLPQRNFRGFLVGNPLIDVSKYIIGYLCELRFTNSFA